MERYFSVRKESYITVQCGSYGNCNELFLLVLENIKHQRNSSFTQSSINSLYSSRVNGYF